MDSSYDIRKDDYFLQYVRSNDVNEVSEERYAKELTKLCKSMDMEFSTIINECKRQQQSKIVPSFIDDENIPSEYVIEEFDANDPSSIILKAQNSFIEFCHKNGNSNVTINNGMYVLRSFFKHYKLELPKWKSLEDDSANWERLTKEDFAFVMNDSSLIHQSLITFMLSTGIRIGDCLNFTIRDFMEATKDYHDFNDVNEFIDKAPEDMLGYWEFEPKKTKRYHIKCATVNSAESSNYILQNLRRIKNEYLPRKSKRIKQELKISKDDALFGSHHKMYKESMNVKSITDQFTLKSHKLHDWRITQINNAIANGKYSEDDFQMLEEMIPKFHAHGCRKYFIDILDKKCADSRLRSLMEGHSPISKNDKSYVKKTKEDVLKVYKDNLWESLTLEGIEVKTITTEEAKELLDKIDRLEEELHEARNTIPTISNQFEKNIWNILYRHYGKSKYISREERAEADVLCQYAFEFAIKDVINFNEDDEKYLDILFDKARAVNELYPDDFDKVRQKAQKHYQHNIEHNMELSLIVKKILFSAYQYGFVGEIVENDYELAKQNVANYVENNNISMDDLDDSELVKKILLKVIVGS